MQNIPVRAVVQQNFMRIIDSPHQSISDIQSSRDFVNSINIQAYENKLASSEALFLPALHHLFMLDSMGQPVKANDAQEHDLLNYMELGRESCITFIKCHILIVASSVSKFKFPILHTFKVRSQTSTMKKAVTKAKDEQLKYLKLQLDHH